METPPPLPAPASLGQFLAKNAQNDAANAPFQLENTRLLEINLAGKIWAKKGAMVARTGAVTFTREGILEHGLGKFLKKMVTGEGVALMKAEGSGRLYLADMGKKVHVLKLAGETFHVNGNDLLAFEPGVDWDIKLMRRVAGMLTGGLFNVKLSGTGHVAITTHYEPLVLQVEPGRPVFTDPNATVAWSGSLTPEIHTDFSLKSLFGRGSGESFQLKFEGAGWVIVQPYEEILFQNSGSSGGGINIGGGE
jgi:uncharacterized protein (AIM24 family)